MARVYTSPYNNFTATTSPGVTDDSSKGYVVGSQWINLSTDTVYELTDSTIGAAIWVALGTTGTVGDVTGPTSSTDNAVVRFDSTTGKLIQNSSATLSDAGLLSTDSVTLTTRINTPEIKAVGSAGIDIHNNSGTQIALFGAGGSNGSTLVGPTNIGSASADYHQIAGGTGTITDTATGSSTDISINMIPKGAGKLKVSGTDVALGGGTATGTNTGDETEATLLSKLTVYADSKNDTGFFDNTNISVSYDKTTRTITLTRTGGIIYYFQGKKYTLSSPWTSSAHTNSAGTYFLYSTDGVTFSWSTTVWTFDFIQVALAIYDGADGWAIREVHGLMDVEAHKSAHNNIGTWRSSGGLLTAGTYAENTATDAANSPGFDLAVINDEDIASTISAWTEGTYTTMYIGASSTATFSTVATLPFTSAGSYIQVNNPSTGALAAGITNRYYNVYQILVPAAADSDSQKRRMLMLQPQATFTSLALAQAEDPRSLSLGDFATKATEFTIYARITYVTSAVDANTGKCRIATGGVSYVIGTRLSSSSLTGSPSNHAGLTNLSWTSSGHTGTASKIIGFDSSGLATEVTLSGLTFDGTTLTGFSWGSSINGATGTGSTLTMDNSYAASGVGQSIVVGNTQSNNLTASKIDLGTSAKAHVGMLINTNNASTTAIGLSITTSSNTATGTGIKITGSTGTAFNGILVNQLYGAANVYGLRTELNPNYGFYEYGKYVNSNGLQGIYSVYTITPSTVQDNATAINIQHSLSGNSINSRTTDLVTCFLSRTGTNTAGTTADNLNVSYFKRTSVQNGAGGTFTSTGPVVKIENVATQTAGTLTDSVPLLSLAQSNNSTGGHILFTAYSGTPTVNNTLWYDGTNLKYINNAGVTKTVAVT